MRGGVETIGLGELAGRAGEVTDLTRIDNRQEQMRRGERACDHGLVSARRLERDQHRMKRAQALDKMLEALVVAREGEGLAAWADANVQPILRHIDSNENIRLPSLHMRARDAAPATVRDFGMDGWGAMLANGLLNPRSARAPIRRRGVKLSNAARRREDTRSRRASKDARPFGRAMATWRSKDRRAPGDSWIAASAFGLLAMTNAHASSQFCASR